MDKIETFIKRLKKIGIDVKLGMNYPWVYIEFINDKRVIETFCGEHGFTLIFIPIKPGQTINDKQFTNITKIFKLIRKYT
jgi:hypothetical protein